MKNKNFKINKSDFSLKSIRFLFDTSKKFIATKQKKYLSKPLFLSEINLNKLKFSSPQEWIEKRINSNYQEVVLTQSQIWTRALIWSLTGGTFFGLGWLSIAKTEEIIVAQGKLEPIKGVVEVQMPLQGVASNIYVKEGELVKKGQVLLKLDTETIQAKIDSFSDSLKINKDIQNRLNLLVKEGAVSELQYLQQKNKLNELQSKIIENEVILKYQRVLAPIDGRVFDLKPSGAGYVARSSEPILKIVPLDNLQARIEIDSRSIGFVSVGKSADISIDSFPASDFGVIAGEVIRIGSDALPPDPTMNKGYRFPADIKLKTQSLNLRNGKPLALQPGMSLTANIKLRKVTYLQLLLGTFQQKADSLREL